MNKRRAIISGATGMDCFYLASYLLSLGYRVTCLKRRSSTDNNFRLNYIIDHPNLSIVSGDITDISSIERIIKEVQPDEFYNLAAMSHVRESFDSPIATAQITGLGALNCLEAIRTQKPDTRFYQASSSEMMGDQILHDGITVLSEKSPLQSRSPYATAKIFAHLSTINYREAYGLFACNGILFNHTEVLRGEGFVERKITSSVAKIHHGLVTKVGFGNLDARRDFGASSEYVKVMHKMLQQDEPDDFVIGTGQSYSPKEILEISAEYAGINSINSHVFTDPIYYRPTEVNLLLANSKKAQTELGWDPSQFNFEDLIKRMTEHDLIWFNPNLPEQEKFTKCRALLGDALS